METNFRSESIIQATEAIILLINDCLGNLSGEHLEVVKARHRDLINQQIFWCIEKNWDRLLYDLRDYANWLLEYIAEAEKNS